MSQPTHGKPKPGDAAPPSGSASGEPAVPSVSGSPAPAPARSDTMLIHGVSEDGESFAVLRARDDRLEAGVVRKVKDGEPLHGELLRLTPRPESPLLCDVEVQYAPPSLPGAPAVLGTEPSHSAEQDTRKLGARKLTHGGPAQVATSSYRANWDAIWSKPKKSSQPN